MKKRKASKNTSICVCLGVIFALAVLTSVILGVSPLAYASETILDVANDDFAEGSVIVVLDESISKINKIQPENLFSGINILSTKDLTERKTNFKSKENFKQILEIKLLVPSKQNVLRAVRIINKLPGVYCAEPNYYYDITKEANDTEYINNNLWCLNGNNGIQANLAWNITTGSKNVRVGVIDSGIANHPDLNSNLVAGYDFFNNNSTTSDDVVSHGTHVAGTIGAVGNNNLGTTGVNWNVSLVPLQVNNANNKVHSSDIIEAINWAEDRWGTSQQIDILNCSIGGFGTDTLVRTAISNYHGLFVWAAGNSNSNVDTNIATYGSFDLPNLISVGSTTQEGDRRYTSNYSSNNTNVNIYAPGTNIYSTVTTTYNSTGYASMSGTSMAAPHVTGVAALMLAKNPSLSAAALKKAILVFSDSITISIPSSSGGTTSQTVRKLNAYKVLTGITTNYTVTLKSVGNIPYSENITVQFGEPMPQLNMLAPKKDGYAFDGYYSSNNKCYYKMELQNDPQTASLNMLDKAIVEKVVPAEEVFWDIPQNTILNGRWENKPLECDSTLLCYYDSEIIGGENVHLTHGSTKITPPSFDGYNFDYFECNNNHYDIDDTIPVQLYRSYSGKIVEKQPLSAYYTKSECVVAGTLITLADGTKVPVETLTGNESLLVWNLFTGEYDEAPILFIDSDPSKTYNVINLTFSDYTTVKVVSEHGFWDKTLNKYVYLREDAAQYIGHSFIKEAVDISEMSGGIEVQLINVSITQETTAVYSPVTYKHFCYYVNGMLSMPGGIEGIINIFDVDSSTMKYNEESMNSDIALYGLYTYQELSEIIPLDEDTFYALDAQYLKVAIGKGLVTIDELTILYSRYSDFFDSDNEILAEESMIAQQ